MKDLDYLPHASAKSLASNRTYSIALIVPFFTNYFTSELLRSLQKAISAINYNLILFSVDRIEKREEIFERVISERRADATVIVSLEVSESFAERFLTKKCPVIILDHMNYRLDTITVANKTAAKTATNHLIQLGHKRVGLINGHLTSYPAILRLQGYKQALLENDLPLDDSITIICDGSAGEHGFNEKAGYLAMRRLMELGSQIPTALFIASDVQALGAMRAAREGGIRIPKDVALVGFDDIEFSKFVGLTTMHQPISDMGQIAVERLVRLLDGETPGGFHRELQASLIIRETCGSRKQFYVQQD